jgi:hypothetical protein
MIIQDVRLINNTDNSGSRPIQAVNAVFGASEWLG